MLLCKKKKKNLTGLATRYLCSSVLLQACRHSFFFYYDFISSCTRVTNVGWQLLIRDKRAFHCLNFVNSRPPADGGIKGRSWRWKEMLRFPQISQCDELARNIGAWRTCVLYIGLLTSQLKWPFPLVFLYQRGITTVSASSSQSERSSFGSSAVISQICKTT